MSKWKVRANSSSGGMIADREELIRGLRLLADQKSGCEIVALPSGRFVNFASDDLSSLIVGIDSLPNGIGIYIRLNPVPIGLGRCAKKADISNRRWLYIDIDPMKPESEKDNPATDQEKEDAKGVGSSVNEYLESLGWPAPVVLESGNGCALLYRVELEATAGIQSLYRKFLLTLQNRFADQPGVIDGSVHDATRLIKLPGTWARKGQCTDDRPYRPCRIVFAPNEPVIVSAAMIEAACEEEKKADQGGNEWKVRATSGGAGSYGRAALDAECARVAMAKPGERNIVLNKAGFSLSQLVAGGELEENEVIARLTEAALNAGLEPNEIAKTLRSSMDAGKKEPRKAPERKDAPKPIIILDDNPIIIWASQVEPKKLSWLWPGYIPDGKLTTFAGQTGQGKTFVTCDIISRVSRGAEWPCGTTGECARKGKTLFISGDDEIDDTIVPRLIECGSDLNMVAFFRPEIQSTWTIAALETLDKAIEKMIVEEVSLVVLDPPTSYLGDVDDHKNSELRGLLTPFKDWAARNNIAVILITHVNKAGGAKIEAIARVMGSVAWVTSVRAAFMLVTDPDDSTQQLFLSLKSNLGPKPKGLAYRIQKTDNLAIVAWLGEVDTTADEAMNNTAPRKRRDVVASEWLIERFREKLEWESNDLFKAAQAEDVSRKAIFEAKKLLDLPKCRKQTRENGDTVWVWWVKEDWPPLSKDDPKDHETGSDEAIVPDLF